MKLGVLLLNLGGPQTQQADDYWTPLYLASLTLYERLQDVEGFLFNLFADPDIIRLPPFLSMLQKPIAYVIAKRRLAVFRTV